MDILDDTGVSKLCLFVFLKKSELLVFKVECMFIELTQCERVL